MVTVIFILSGHALRQVVLCGVFYSRIITAIYSRSRAFVAVVT